ncbi:MAG: histone deacetylase [bacterium]|nr:histone deacetylase [bacterium]
MSRPWRQHGVGLVYHRLYARPMTGSPVDPQRAERILAFVAQERLIQPEEISTPRLPSVKNLLRVHSSEYLEAVQETETLERIFGVELDDGDAQALLELQRLMVGGTIQATRMVRRGFDTAVNLGGGLHHARAEMGAGFCIFNDVAVATARLRARGFKSTILVIDLDMHDGDGTRAIFANDPSVYTYSVHNHHWGEVDAQASTAIALGDDVTDDALLGTLVKTLPEVVESVDPGLVFYVAGTDPAADDVLGNWQISEEALLARDRYVVDLVKNRSEPVPLVVLLGGGYGDRSWSYTARFLSWLLTGRTIEPPANDDLTLMQLRRILREMDPSAFTAEPSEDNGFSWRLTDEDLEGILPGVPRRTRFLRYFSQHGLELLLERVGIYDQLRLRGFTHPFLDLDLTHPVGQTLRIFGASDKQELLVELRVNRSQQAVPDLQMLVIEWLLLQNPRAGFGPFRQPLPGQNHPGLGMLKQVLGWLVVVCEMLDLDGLYFTPSSYHVATQSRAMVRFVHPEHEARFRALKECLREVPLADASLAVDKGLVVDAATDLPLEWEGFPMVLAVSERLKDRLFSDEYEQRVADELARQGLKYRQVACDQTKVEAISEGDDG